MATIGASIFQFLMGAFPLLIVVTLIISHSPLNATRSVPTIFALILVCTGVGLLMSTLFVFFRDLPYFYELVTFGLWIGSPIFYPAEIVPEKVSRFLALNPILPIIESIRQIVLSGNSPDLGLIAHSLVSGVIVLVIGAIIFANWRAQFMDLL